MQKMRFFLCAAFCVAFAATSQADPVSTSISQGATGFLSLGNELNPPPNPAVITNTVTVVAAGGAGTPTGSVTATLYRNDNSCGTPPFFQAGSQPLVNGSATFSIPAEQIGFGAYRWVIAYTSDQPTQYANSSSNCNAANSIIVRAVPTLSVQTSKFTATLGETDQVKATLFGGYKPFGNVTFYASGPNDLSCSQKTALATLPVGSDATVTYSFSPAQPGTYVLTAVFAGDNLNEGASTGCGEDGTVTFIPPGPRPAASFKVTAPPNVYAGQSFDFTVTAYDAYSQVATGYNGTVHFTSSNGAGLPADATLTNGRATFQATLNANGSQTITATDTNISSITGTTNIFAYPQSSFVVTSTSDSDNGTCGSVCTLRDAIKAANNQAGPATITFNIPNMAGCTAANQCTIALGATLPAVNDDVAINGSANNAQITVEGQFRRILNVNSGKRATMTALTLRGGSVGGNPTGGAIHNDGTLYLSGMNFMNNGNSNVSGGAIGNGPTGTLDITGSSFSNNVVTGGSALGGAIYNQGNLTIRQSNFNQNTAQDAHGGAICHDSGSMTITDSTFTNNQTPHGSGAAIFKQASATITNSTFMNNSSVGHGGAISASGPTTLANCTFYSNSAQGDGLGRGGIFNFQSNNSSPQRITNCTFFNNVTGPRGFGAIANNTNHRDVILRNVLMSNNTGGNCGGSAKLNSDSSNMVDDATCGSATQKTLGEINPGFPADNGGPTKTIALYPGSAAIDAGNDEVGKAAVGSPGYGAGGMDQRGVPRPQGSHCDVGAFELVPSQPAAIPIIGPLGGTYQDMVQVSITSTSAGTAVRYSLDGSTPSDTNGLLYTGPFNLTQTKTVKAIAYGGGWLSSPIASVGFTVLTPLPYWRNLHGLAADGSRDLENPSGDGIANLLKFAFNMAPNAGDLSKPNISILPDNGNAGLPYMEVDAQGRLVIEFVRRKASSNPGIAYIVETGSDLNNLMSLSLAGASVVSIDSKWERVTITDPTVSTKRFGRVRIQPLGVYFNDFNAALGAATLSGSATYVNQAVQLTDGSTQSQIAAVIFNGVTVGPQVTGFTARFNLALGPSATGTPADGASFAVGTLPATWSETGPQTSHSLAVGFDTYNNGGIGDIGIHVWVNGVHLTANPTNPYTNGATVPVEITYDQSAGLTVKFNGTTIFSSVAIAGFSFQSSDKFGIGARTGGAVERAVVDDVEIAPR